MKLISFQIKGFKSIIDTGECKLSEIDNVVVLAGQNEAGKSAVLEALDFFKNGPGAEFGRLQKRQNTPLTEVVCKFSFTDDDLTKIKEGFNDQRIDTFFLENKIVEIRRISEDVNTKDLEIPDSYFAPLKEVLEKRVEITGTVQNDSNPEPTDTVSTSLSGPPSADPIISSLKQHIITRIPIVTLYSAFKDFLPSEIPVVDIPNNSAVGDFQRVFQVDLAKISAIADLRQLTTTTENLEKKATDDFNNSWSQKLSIMDETKYSFLVRFNPAVNNVTFMIKGSDNIPLYLEQKSAGFRWFSAFNLRLRALGVDKDKQNNLILLIDEPGQNLHESAQLDAKQILEELAGKGVQIIYSTHNAKLIGTQGKEFARLRLVSNSVSHGTRVDTIPQFASRSNGGSSMDALSPIITAMGLSSISSFVDPQRLNVVVEGITDHYYFVAFKKILSREEKLYFVPACGVSNVPNLVSVLMGWGFKYKAVFDDDKVSGRKAYNLLKKEFYEGNDEETHQHVLKIPDCVGIENVFSYTDFYKYVLNEPIPKTKPSKRNSELVTGKKEVVARMFLERVENGETIEFEKETKQKINDIFTWIYDKFELSTTN